MVNLSQYYTAGFLSHHEVYYLLPLARRRKRREALKGFSQDLHRDYRRASLERSGVTGLKVAARGRRDVLQSEYTATPIQISIHNAVSDLTMCNLVSVHGSALRVLPGAFNVERLDGKLLQLVII